MTYSFHPAAELFPMLTEAELCEMAEDIRKHGLREPIKLFDGQILDGRNRYIACQQAGIEPLFETLAHELDPYAYVWSENAERRHLKEGTKAVIFELFTRASEAWKVEQQRVKTEANKKRAEIAEERPRTEMGTFQPSDTSIDVSLGTSLPHQPDRSQWIGAKKAKAAGVSEATVIRSKAVIDKRPDLAEQVRRQELSLNAAYRQMKREEEPPAQPVNLPLHQLPILFVGKAEHLPLPDNSVDVIITSPPYNIGPKGGKPEQREDGRAMSGGRAWVGIDYEQPLPENDYQDWQLAVLAELYRVAKAGASLFYNHKVRQRQGAMIHPMQWLLKVHGWTLRQEIIWDRGSTHNHEPSYFWPHDERIFWLTKGSPILPEHGIKQSTIWNFHGPVADTWHISPFPEELPRRCLAAVGAEEKVVLDPFGGSMTVCAVALAMGAAKAIGCDCNRTYVERACTEYGWDMNAIQAIEERQ